MKKMAGAKYFKRALIMVSDTDHSGSNSQRDQLLETVRRSHVLVYSISIDTRQSSHHPALDRICSVSGGFAKSAQNSAEILDLMEIVSLELKHQYLITFVPTNVSSTVDEWHRFRFAVKPLLVQKSSSKKYEELPLFIRSREGYYPSQ
jgi:hypothetical protein